MHREVDAMKDGADADHTSSLFAYPYYSVRTCSSSLAAPSTPFPPPAPTLLCSRPPRLLPQSAPASAAAPTYPVRPSQPLVARCKVSGQIVATADGRVQGDLTGSTSRNALAAAASALVTFPSFSALELLPNPKPLPSPSPLQTSSRFVNTRPNYRRGQTPDIYMR